MDPDPLLTIGEFAARARLSPKALRLYDRLGLLTPAYVDGATGYRYYRTAQVEDARTVVLLRRLGMPLADIAGIVGLDGEQAARAVAAYWAGVEERHAEQRTLAGYLRGRLSGRGSAMDEMNEKNFPVRTVDVPEQYVISETRHLLAEELPVWIDASLGRLEEAAEAECGGAADAPLVIYHSDVTQDSDGPAEACVPVRDAAAARAWAQTAGRQRGAESRVEPAHRLAFTRITKAQVSYPQILAAFQAVEEWIAREGLKITGPSREIYFAEWETTGPDDQVCDVAFPVSR
ncbi:MerR family transcriptional regulator [Streptomyces sp. NBC_01381]|uniref:MerR family transcriptional regulator n=1 Tax=Streptomyces sp. NBC_01381 TaxID=2903845 RepID=UPI0022593761|nr:MerR family transcriptional regulator [Streptomyces sp. NBC_01381]MCX4666381.1 MerR family transcriptional regulator [Streptomyces sp. NBC_01381]